MKIVFIGAREMGYECLRFLLAKYSTQLVAVYTNAESLNPKIAGNKPFDGLLAKKSVPFHKIENINDPKVIEQIRSYEPDLIVQIAWSQIIKDEILRIPKLGCVGFHSSLLPRYRGGSPVNWGLINGEKEWGITFFYMAPGVDSGDIIAQEEFEITLEDTCKTVYEKCTKHAVKVLEKYLPLIGEGKAPRTKQKEMGTPLKRRKPEDGLIDWKKPTLELYNWVRALTQPYPGAFTFYNGKKLFVWKAIMQGWGIEGAPGQIVGKDKGGIRVQTGDGTLVLQLVQEEEKKEVNGADYPVKKGEMLG